MSPLSRAGPGPLRCYIESGAPMPQTIGDHLEFLYGRTVATAMEPRVRQLMTKYFPSPARVTDRNLGLPLNARHAILNTYRGQVREAGSPHIRTLGAFLDRYASGAVSAVHLLPFYPSSSDDGFSVVDYYAVDPHLGGWEDVGSIGEHFQLMFDAVFNHLSAESEWF